MADDRIESSYSSTARIHERNVLAAALKLVEEGNVTSIDGSGRICATSHHAPNAKDNRDGLLYTRVLATSYDGRLLEILFTSNTDKDPVLKDRIDKVMESLKLENAN
ncbi:MAG TPA: hypothetical protein VLO30_03950 [Chthoniobacterales bacterium]|nr:hypothetical protein [Chthoniobacterales bacterium]